MAKRVWFLKEKVYSWIKADETRRDKMFLAKVGQILERTCIKHM